MRTAIFPLTALLLTGLWGCEALEYPELEESAFSMGVGPVIGEGLSGAPDLDLPAWCAGLMAAEVDPCDACTAGMDACRLTCSDPAATEMACGPIDPEGCAVAEEQCARCELCAQFAPPPQVEAGAQAGPQAPLTDVAVDADLFNVDLHAVVPEGRSLPGSAFPEPTAPTPEPPPCSLDRPVFDDLL